MPRRPARLSNTYVPLPLKGIVDDGVERGAAPPIRGDRGHQELRLLCLETSILSQPPAPGSSCGGAAGNFKCLGSSLVELGHTKVLCEVDAVPTDMVDTGSLQCNVQFAKHMGQNAAVQRLRMVSPLESTGGGAAGTSAPAGEAFSIGKLQNATTQMEADLGNELAAALRPVLRDHCHKYPKCAVRLQLTILQDDGSVLSACIAASSLALMDAQVEMTDVVTSCTVAVVASGGGESAFLADPTQEETMRARAVICLAMTPNRKEVTLWRQSGRLTSDMANRAIELCRSGCRTMHKFMREVWVVSPTSA